MSDRISTSASSIVGATTTMVMVSPWIVVAVGSMIGSLTMMLFLERKKKKGDGKAKSNCSQKQQDCSDSYLIGKRNRIPSLILLLRHGESELNADNTLWRTKPDNLISLTSHGIEESEIAGQRIERIFQSFDEHDDTAAGQSTNNPLNEDLEDESKLSQHSQYNSQEQTKIRRVHIHVSPYERTLQTAKASRPYFEHRVVRTSPESRIREQEFGNFLSMEDSITYRKEQQQVGRFWYRFPTGESGADVYDRIKSWWYESVLKVNERIGYDKVDALVVVTHSLSMRFVLMQLYNWSPMTFHSVWSAQSCDLYVLRKDLSKPGESPYVLDNVLGDMPKSSVKILVQQHQTKENNSKSSTTTSKVYRLDDYLSIPPPRTMQLDIIKQRLIEQYPDEIHNVDDIESISFQPFHCGEDIEEDIDPGSIIHATNKIDKDNDIRNEKSSTPVVRNALDDVDTLIHHDVIKQGQLEGKAAGEIEGYEQGRILGQTKGIDYGLEIGFALGLVEAVKEEQDRNKKHSIKAIIKSKDKASSETDNNYSDRIIRSISELEKAIDKFPPIKDSISSNKLNQQSTYDSPDHDIKNDDDIKDASERFNSFSSTTNVPVDVQKAIQRIRARSRVLLSKLGLPHHTIQNVMGELHPQQNKEINGQQTQMVHNVTPQMKTDINNQKANSDHEHDEDDEGSQFFLTRKMGLAEHREQFHQPIEQSFRWPTTNTNLNNN